MTINEEQVRALLWDGVVPLEQVLELTRVAYGRTWEQVTAGMRADQDDWRLVLELQAELLRAGTGLFDEPVRVYFEESEDWTPEDQAEFGDRPILPTIGNGMHRVVAASLAGAPAILVTSKSWDDQADPFGGDLVQVSYRLEGDFAASRYEDSFDFATSHLRSFRLTPDAWVEVATQGSCNDVHESIYHCPHHLEGQLLDALEGRATQEGFKLRMVDSRPTTWEKLKLDKP